MRSRTPVWLLMVVLLAGCAVPAAGPAAEEPPAGTAPAQAMPTPPAPAPAPPAAPLPAGPVDVYTETVEADGLHVSVSVAYPRLEGLADPAVAARINDVFARAAEATLAAAADDEEQIGPEPTDPRHLFRLTYWVAHNADGVLSVVFDDYGYWGGAHGGTRQFSHTYRTADGHEYTLGELLGPIPGWQAEASALIEGELRAEGYLEGRDFPGIDGSQSFYVQAGRAVVYFQQYEHTPYAAGIPEFELPWELQY